MEPSQLQTFVANRVARIQELTDTNLWRHVPTDQNPCDCVSRGIMPHLLENMQLYWQGPTWLKDESSLWLCLSSKLVDVPERRKTIQCHSTSFQFSNNLFNRFSSLTKLQRVVAYIIRFRNNASKSKMDRNSGPLTTFEMNVASKTLIAMCQNESFKEEILALSRNNNLSSKNRISSLNPFLDSDGIIRKLIF